MKRQPRYSKGQKIGGRFLVHQALMGGMGEVYLCLDEQEFEPIALKTFQGSSPELADIFKGEVANWIALEKHPNIVFCGWMQTFDNIPFMALEWVAGDESKGTNLRSWLRHGPLDLALALRLTIDICRGLRHAGEKVPGIVHRDLKPDNVLVNQDRQAKITDFGLAMVMQRAGIEESADMETAMLEHIMRVGSIVGTPFYMPPEQWQGETNLDFRTDLYAVGCILYELLMGKWLYGGHSVSELREQHLEAPIPSLNGDFPHAVNHILGGCLAKQRADRFARLELLLAELSKLYEAQVGEAYSEVRAGEMTARDYDNGGVTFVNLGQHERAIADFDRAIELDPKLAPAYVNRGNSYGKLKRCEQAIIDYDRAIELDPSDAKTYVNRGSNHEMMGDHQRAIIDYDCAIELDPSDAMAYSNRGISYGRLKQYERAIADYDRAIELNPSDASAYLNRGVSLAITGHLQDALSCFEKAYALGLQQAAGAIERAREELGLPPMQVQTNTSNPQAAFEAFQGADSPDAMRQAVEQFPVLAQMIPTIEKVIEQDAPPDARSALRQNLDWLKEVAKGG